MNTRSSLILGSAIVLGCLILTLFSNSSSVGQPPVASKEGRYQVAVGQVAPNLLQQGGTPQSQILVTDTTNGQTWVIKGVDNWYSLGKAPK